MTDLQVAATAIINKFGKTVSYQTPTGTAMNIYGDESFTWGTATSTKAIVERPDEESMAWKTEGGVTTGRLYFYMPADETITIGDKISYDSLYWLADEVLKYQFFNKYAVLRVAAYRTSD